jgi:hypothetical protein
MYGTIDAVGRGFPRSKPERTIVGIAADAPLVNVSGTQVAELYVPIEPRDYGRLVLLARARGTAGGLTQPLIDAARAADPRVLPRTALPAARLGERVQGRRAATLAAGFAGVLASSLACFGIFGIVAYGACRRTQEIGIRRALGAHGRSIVFLLLRQLAMPVAFGVVLGTLAGTAAARMLEGEPFYLPGQDAAVSLAALALFLAVAAAAAVVPAIRALRVDPLAALRQE